MFFKTKKPKSRFEIQHIYTGPIISRCFNTSCVFYEFCNSPKNELINVDDSLFENVAMERESIEKNGTLYTTIKHCPGAIPSTRFFVYENVQISGVLPFIDSPTPVQIYTIDKGGANILLEFRIVNDKIFVYDSNSYIKFKTIKFKAKEKNTFDIYIMNNTIFVTINGKQKIIKTKLEIKDKQIEIRKNFHLFKKILPFQSLSVSLIMT